MWETLGRRRRDQTGDDILLPAIRLHAGECVPFQESPWRQECWGQARGCSQPPAQPLTSATTSPSETIKSIEKGEARGWWLSRGSEPSPGVGHLVLFQPAESLVRVPLESEAQNSAGWGATWTLCSPCCEFPPMPHPPFSLWPWAEQAFLILGLVGWFQGSWLQGAEGGESGGLRCLGSRAQSSVLTLRSLVFSMCLQLEGSRLSSHGTSVSSSS